MSGGGADFLVHGNRAGAHIPTLIVFFADLPVLNEFALRFHEYGSRYIEQLGVQLGNPALAARHWRKALELNAENADDIQRKLRQSGDSASRE